MYTVSQSYREFKGGPFFETQCSMIQLVVDVAVFALFSVSYCNYRMREIMSTFVYCNRTLSALRKHCLRCLGIIEKKGILVRFLETGVQFFVELLANLVVRC